VTTGVRQVVLRLKQVNTPLVTTDDKWWKSGAGFVSGEAPLLPTDNAASWRVTATLPTTAQLTPGQYYLYAYAFDRLGNRTDARISFTVSR
jgi:hypothetical protein